MGAVIAVLPVVKVGNKMSAIRIEVHFSIGLKVSQTMLFQCLLSFYEQLLRNPVCGAKKSVAHNHGLLFRLFFYREKTWVRVREVFVGGK
jgi:hypothetical protein